MHLEPAAAIGVCAADDNAYCAHVAARFRVCVYVPKPNVISSQSQALAIKSWFLVVQSPWESRINLQSGTLLQVTN